MNLAKELNKSKGVIKANLQWMILEVVLSGKKCGTTTSFNVLNYHGEICCCSERKNKKTFKV